MKIREMINAADNIILQVSVSDLRTVIKEMCAEERRSINHAIEQNREQFTIGRRETALRLGVSLSTLWHWQKAGYLVPAKVGTKVLYRASDIEKLLTSAQKGGEV